MDTLMGNSCVFHAPVVASVYIEPRNFSLARLLLFTCTIYYFEHKIKLIILFCSV